MRFLNCIYKVSLRRVYRVSAAELYRLDLKVVRSDKDTTGAVVPDAMVTVRNTGTGAARVVQTGSDGVYTVPGLAPSLYDVTIRKTGFADYKTQATITVGSHVTLDAALSVSQVSTTVEVVAVAGGGAEINTQTQEISQIITPQQVENLPSISPKISGIRRGQRYNFLSRRQCCLRGACQAPSTRGFSNFGWVHSDLFPTRATTAEFVRSSVCIPAGILPFGISCLASSAVWWLNLGVPGNPIRKTSLSSANK